MQKGEWWKWVKGHPKMLVVAALVAGNFFLFTLIYQREHGELTVAFLDVGQGDAVFIEAPNGNQLLYDAGPPSGAALRALSGVMPFWDRSIDVAILSHPDLDHIGGFPEIFNRYKVDLALVSGAVSDNGIYDETETAVAKEGAARLLARRGMRVELGGGVSADIFYPDRDMSTMETNSASIVMRVLYGETAFLLSGDLPIAIEEYLTKKDGSGLASSVLKLGHHGSRTSTSPYFLAAVAPSAAVVSAGRDNRYGHPHKEVLELLKEKKIETFLTSEEGTIIFKSDGVNIVRK